MDGSPGLDLEKDTCIQDNIHTIGAVLRAKRQERGMSLRELSRLSSLSVGFLSLVERGRSSLALTSLANVARALGVELSGFFPGAREEVTKQKTPSLPYVHRTGEGGQLEIISSQRTYTMLTPRMPGLVLEPIFVTVQPGDTMDEPYAHDGEEFAYVLSGELVFIVDGAEYRLAAGDSIYLRSTVAHAMHNDTDKPVQAIWVLTPRLM
jgi:quercetin dioxygenase-like cupin family protein